MSHTSSRPLAVLLAAAFALGLWLPTLSVPQAQAAAACQETVALPVLA